MNSIFVTIVQYIIDNPGARDKKAHEIYNSCITNSAHKPQSFDDVKIVLDYINNAKRISDNVLLDAIKGGALA